MDSKTFRHFFNMRITEYPIGVYQDFEKAVSGDDRFQKKLMDDGYPEWAAFANGILGDDEAVLWLLQNGYPEMGVLANGMDDEPGAMKWLNRHPELFYYCFCQATKNDKKAIDWLEQNRYPVFVLLAKTIRKAMLRRIKRETFWYKIKW